MEWETKNLFNGVHYFDVYMWSNCRTITIFINCGLNKKKILSVCFILLSKVILQTNLERANKNNKNKY